MDARLNLLSFALLIIFPLFLITLQALLLVLAYLIVFYMVSRFPLRLLFCRFKRISFFIVLVMALNLILVKDDSSTLSMQGLYSGAFYSLRILVIYYAVVIFLLLTPQEEMASGLALLTRPLSPTLSRKLALYGFISIGFLPVFSEEIRRIRLLQSFRGGELKGGFIRKITSVRSLLVPLIISAIHRSSQLAMVVELRRLESAIEAVVSRGAPSVLDYMWFLLTATVIASAVLWLN